MHKKNYIFSIALFSSSILFAQTDVQSWYLQDPASDNVHGISLQKAYDFLKNKKPVPIIVAVIDGGVDTTHEDLKSILWKNPGEITGNGIDDDGNGYIDDIYGWNFLGNSDGANITKENSEKARTYYRFKEKFENKEIDTATLNAEEKWQYKEWKKASVQMSSSPDEQFEVMMLEMTCKSLKKQDELLRNEMQKTEFTKEELEKYQPHSSKCKQAKMAYITFLHLLNIDGDETNTNILKELQEFIDGKKSSLNASVEQPEDYRAAIVKDNYTDFSDRYYGNGDVMGDDPEHGTHVSGIIAAQRDNGIGINGIANDVKLMMLRAVPNGDEYDKDIALSIRYAVDNGAKIINMSFGKSFSPDKKWVDEAIAYAQSKDVLLVHAAGNESWDVDSTDNFPNASLSFINSEANNFLNVGASGDAQVGDGKLIAYFSNYGAQTVDVFAPGVKIYSTLPRQAHYGFMDGTSFSAPIVSGIAALIRSYYPQLNAQQVKLAIENSVMPIPDSLSLPEPGTNKTVCMKQLCFTGGIVNAEKALKFADALQPQLLQTANQPQKNSTGIGGNSSSAVKNNQ